MVKFQFIVVVFYAIMLLACNQKSETNHSNESSKHDCIIENDNLNKKNQKTNNENSRFYTSSDTVIVII